MRIQSIARVGICLATAGGLSLTGVQASGAPKVGAENAAADLACVVDVNSLLHRCAATEAAALAELAEVAPASTVVITRLYDGVNHEPPSLTFVAASPCTPEYDPEYQWDDLRELGFNNRATSLHTYNRCDVKLFDGVFFGQPESVWIDESNLNNIGTGWSNRASSLKFS